MNLLIALQLLTGAVSDSVTGNGQPANANNSPEIAMNIGWFLILIFIIIGIAAFIAFICYHAKDKKIEQLKKLIYNPLSEKEIQLITEYRKLNEQNKQVIDSAAKNLKEVKSDTDETTFTKE